MNNPIELKCELCDIDLEGMTVDEAITELNEIKSQIKPGFTKVVIECVSYSEDYSELKLVGYRPETDGEMVARIARDKQADLAEFERLKAKLGA